MGLIGLNGKETNYTITGKKIETERGERNGREEERGTYDGGSKEGLSCDFGR